MWFANRNDEGVAYHKYFNSFPIEVIALVLAVVSFTSDALMFHSAEYPIDRSLY
jgi:hypothetical protein